MLPRLRPSGRTERRQKSELMFDCERINKLLHGEEERAERVEHLFFSSVLIIARKGKKVKRKVKINVFCIKCGIFNGQFVQFTC